MCRLGTDVKRWLDVFLVFFLYVNHRAVVEGRKLRMFYGGFQLFGLVEFNLHG
jgi:hypothetical protein